MTPADDPQQDGGRPDDPYSRAQYRKLIAWGQRITREAPFLRELLEEAPERSVLDIGCGSGEHVAWFASEGARALGLDRSEAMIESARDHEGDGGARFLLGDVLDLPPALADEPPFGLALCLGNMLPHVLTQDELQRFAHVLHERLLPGGVLLIQMLNYGKLLQDDVNVLPVNVRPGEPDDERIIFLRLMSPAPDGGVLFFPTTLTLDPESEEPVQVHTTRRVALRAWEPETLRAIFEDAGFSVRLHGDMQCGGFVPAESHDLVVVAARAGDDYH